MLAGDPLIRVKPKDLAAAGVRPGAADRRSGRGATTTNDGRRLDVANVVWCTGFHPGFSWIDLPVLGPAEPKHNRGIVEDEPGLLLRRAQVPLLKVVGADPRVGTPPAPLPFLFASGKSTSRRRSSGRVASLPGRPDQGGAVGQVAA